MFESLELAPADPILGLNEAFQKDPNAAKINLGIGVYKDEHGATPVLECVKRAESQLLRGETTKSYLPMVGLPKYGRLVQQLLFGEAHPLLQQERVATIQTPGGTGALRVAADFVHQHYPPSAIWCSRPTWANHAKIFQAAGLAVKEYAYLDTSARGVDFAAFLSDLNQIPEGDMVVLHGCCHNPSGVDPSEEQWTRIARTLAQRKHLPLIDFAYQGFGTGLDSDAAGLRTVAQYVDEFLVASSFSKNFGLYRERVGALSAVAKSREQAGVVLSHLKTCVRANYSNPPAHGAATVEAILSDDVLRKLWEGELTVMRTRIGNMRRLFVERMRDAAPTHDFSFLLQQNGMFSFSGLRPDQVDRLRDEHSIYIVRSGRINVAGITPSNVDRICQATASVLD